jgi:TolB-like protein
MPESPPAIPDRAVFLSYAREDTDAARRIANALAAFGVEVWFDQSELRGGDAWDQTIKKQIRECALFLPLVSSQTQQRAEGYFRREWWLAVDRTRDMAQGIAFIVPLVIDDTSEAHAAVPEEFLRVQSVRLPGALPTPEFVTQIKHLLAQPRRPANAGSIRHAATAVAPHARAASAIADKSIAVLPFVNLSADPENEYFSDGMTEEIINALVQVPGLHVAARTSVFALKGKADDLRTIAGKLNVRTVLEGSVRKAGNRIRVTAQLINADDGHHLWSERFDRELADVFAIQDEIALNIVGKLKISLLGEEKQLLLKRPTENLEAHSWYLKGRHFYRQATMEGLQKALEAYQRAIESDPTYAPAFAALAYTYVWVTTAWLALPARETMPKARAAAQQALALDPTLPEAHVSLALVATFYDWDLAGADRAFKEALRLNPNYAEAHGWYTAPLIWLDTHFAEALEHARRAVELNPLDPWARFQLCWTHYFSRDYEGAINQTRHLIDLEPFWGLAHYWLGGCLATVGRAAEALESSHRAIELDGRAVHCIAWLGVSNAIAGKLAEARACLAELATHEKEGRSVAAWKLPIHSALGDSDAVMRCLNEAFDERSASLVFHLTHPLIDGLRGDPRFLDLLRRMGLEHLAAYRPNPSWRPFAARSQGQPPP